MKKWLCFILLFIFSLTSQPLWAQSPNHNNIIYLFGSDSDTYINQLEMTNGQTGTVAPNYFGLTPDGNLAMNIDEQFIEDVHDLGYRITPFISNHWDRALGAKAMQNGQKLADDLAAAVLRYDLDGVNIDIENLSYAERDLQTQFLKRLSEKLQPHGKTVSIAVAPAQSDTTNGWVGSYDFEAIGKIVDTVFVMAYDQSYETGPAGPVAGLPWVEKSIRYLVKKVPRDKLVLGVPFYGRYWTETDKGKGIKYSAAMDLIEKNQATVQYDAKNATNIAKFKDKQTGKDYEIWFDSAETILERIALAEKYGLRGWGAWALGQEDTRVWSALGGKALSFKDISNHWAEKDILFISSQKWIHGYQDRTFRPKNPISREEVATLLTNVLKFDIKKDTHYTDISETRWSFPYVSTISTYGMMKGYPDQTFRPENPITRAEFAAALVRSFSLPADTNPTEEGFTDVQAHWAKDDIVKLYKSGIIKGYQDGSFRPNQLVTRAEAASMLSRILQ